MKSYLSRLIVLSLGTALLVPTATAADWGNWRGPAYNGSSDAKNLPAEFGPNQNVLWTAKLPGAANNTPIVSGDRVFLTAIDESRRMLCIAVDRKTGKELWRHDAGIARISPKGENDVAAPSPATDGKIVVFLFGTGDIVALDVEGKKLWSRNLQVEVGAWNINWIYGSSPLIWNGKLYVQVLHTDQPYQGTALQGAAKYPDNNVPSYLLALEPATGKQLWRHDRPTESVKETKESYATPVPHKTAAGREELIIIGGSAITGHDPATGTEIWRFTGWDPNKEPYWRLVPSVVTGAGVIIGCAPKGGPVMAVKEGGTGDVSATHKAWFSDGKELTSDVPVPLFYKDHFFVLEHTTKKLSKVEPATGKIVWSTPFEGAKVVSRASPTGADNKIYCMNAAGDIWVVSPDDGKILHKTSLGGNPKTAASRGSIVALDGMLLVRSGDTVFAFGQK